MYYLYSLFIITLLYPFTRKSTASIYPSNPLPVIVFFA